MRASDALFAGTGALLVGSLFGRSEAPCLMLEIELPVEGWTQVETQSLYIREGYGYAVSFVAIADDTWQRLERVIERLGNRIRLLIGSFGRGCSVRASRGILSRPARYAAVPPSVDGSKPAISSTGKTGHC